MLGEPWTIEPSPDELCWPDLIVTTDLGKFGLEVREIYLDESSKGSTKKANEQFNLKTVKMLTDYYKANHSSIKADFLGDVGHHDQLLSAITRTVPQLSELEEKRIEPCNGCAIYVLRLPDQLGKYKRWSYVSDNVGWVSNIDKDVIDRAIIGKARNLPKYAMKISDVRLLVVSDRVSTQAKLA